MSSSGHRPTASWRWTSSLWRRSGFGLCMCCSRSVSVPGACASSVSPRTPTSAWVTQQARNLAVGSGFEASRFVIRDRDSKFSGPFDEVFRSEGVRIVRTPIRAPRANAFAERWVRTVRAECLDRMLVLGRRHGEQVLRAYAAHYNKDRQPHRGLDLRTPRRRPHRPEGHTNPSIVTVTSVFLGVGPLRSPGRFDPCCLLLCTCCSAVLSG